MLKYKGLIALMIVIMIHLLSAGGASQMIYNLYSTYVFPFIRVAYDYTLGLLPLGFVYVLVLLLLGYVVYSWKKSNQKPKKTLPFKIFSILDILGWIVFLFYFLWGFNYYRPSLVETNRWTAVDPDTSMVYAELMAVSEKVNELRKKLSRDTSCLSSHPDWSEIETEIRQVQEVFIHSLGTKAHGNVRIRQFFPKGLLLSFSTAGIYIPFVCEGHIDPGLNPIQWPFTAAHEMAHGYGYTDEGECNFIGLITCSKSKNPYIQYSGYLGYWRYLYRAVYNISEKKAENVFLNLESGVQADLRAIRRDINRYPDIFPWLRDVIYEFYLQSHGMTDGLASYDGIIALTLTYKKNL